MVDTLVRMQTKIVTTTAAHSASRETWQLRENCAVKDFRSSTATSSAPDTTAIQLFVTFAKAV
jgi:hypothetical protein